MHPKCVKLILSKEIVTVAWKSLRAQLSMKKEP
jgi:hypothetical protein